MLYLDSPELTKERILTIDDLFKLFKNDIYAEESFK